MTMPLKAFLWQNQGEIDFLNSNINRKLIESIFSCQSKDTMSLKRTLECTQIRGYKIS